MTIDSFLANLSPVKPSFSRQIRNAMKELEDLHTEMTPQEFAREVWAFQLWLAELATEAMR